MKPEKTTASLTVPKSEVFLQDCMEGLKQLPDKYFELAIVDPPYGIDINMNMGRKAGKAKHHEDKVWDASPPDALYFKELFRVSSFQIIWGGNYFDLPKTASWIFWDKLVPIGVSFADGELAWTSGDKTLIKITVPYSGFVGSEGKIHPTQKPVALYKKLLTLYAKPGDSILDTHVGSGSSRVACHEFGCTFTGYEIDPDYFAAQDKRFQNHISQLNLFTNGTRPASNLRTPQQEAHQDLPFETGWLDKQADR